MEKRLHLILLGLPNGGKGTLTKQLRSIFEKKGDIVTEIPMSSILREKRPDTINLMEKGELVPDYIVIPEATYAITEAEGNVLIYDGFPRTIAQALSFLETVEDEEVGILELNTPEAVAIQRAENRLVCSNCGSPWSKTGEMAPMEAGKCDMCGGRLIRRKDDEIIEKRIKVHKKCMIPAAAFLKEKGVPFTVVDYKLKEEGEIAKCISPLFS